MHTSSATRRALLAAHSAVALFGIAGLFAQWVALPPLGLVLGRTAFAAMALGAVAGLGRWAGNPLPGAAGAPRGTASRRGYRLRLALSMLPGGIVLCVHWLAFFASIQQASIATGLLGYATFPLWVLLLEAATQRRRLRRRELEVAGLVVVGLSLLAFDARAGASNWPALGLAVLSGATFALLIVVNREQTRWRDPLDIALGQNVVAALALAAVVAFVGLPPGWASLRTLVLLAVLGIVCTAFAHTLFIASLARLSAHTASVVAALEPIYGIALAWLLLHETPSLRALAAASVLIAAAAVASTRSARTTDYRR